MKFCKDKKRPITQSFLCYQHYFQYSTDGILTTREEVKKGPEK